MGSRLSRIAAAVGVSAVVALALAVAQAQEPAPGGTPTTVTPPPGPAATPPTPTPAISPPPATAAAPANAATTDDEEDKSPEPPPPGPPPPPPTPERAPLAVLRVLDKVTAETMAFAAPVGQRVRYKSLVFEVKVCETRGAGDPEPQPAAYLTITSDAGASAGALGPRQVFKGWMFANAPSVHALAHPVYDAWLVSCSAATPAT